jgi:hypothetical protein
MRFEGKMQNDLQTWEIVAICAIAEKLFIAIAPSRAPGTAIWEALSKDCLDAAQAFIKTRNEWSRELGMTPRKFDV